MYNDKELIELFGYPFCFTHGTHVENLPQILKKEELHFSSEVENNKYIRKDWGGGKYTYCTAIFKENPMTTWAVFWANLIIDPKIMFEHEIIFNSTWLGRPHQTKEESEDNLNNLLECFKDLDTTGCIDRKVHLRQFSIYLFPNDTVERRKFKLKLIKYFVMEMVEKDDRSLPNNHEFLFTKRIDLKKYMTHVLILDSAKRSIYKKSQNKIKSIEKIIKKRKEERKYSLTYTTPELNNTINKYIFTWPNDNKEKQGYYLPEKSSDK